MQTYVGVDLGDTTVQSVIARADGQVLAERSIATQSHQSPEIVLGRVADVVNDLRCCAEVSPVALGMGVPGLVDLAAGISRFPPNLPGQWRDVPVREILSPQIGCDVYLLNDVRSATLGELTFGRGKYVDTMAFFTLGTGIGGGVVVDGRLRLGPLGAAGELGHQTILPDGLRCGCGNRGCLETLASATAMVAEGIRLLRGGQAPVLHGIVEGDAGRMTTKEMATAAAQGDESVAEAITRAAEYLGIGIANVASALHPELVVLGGGAAAIGELLFDTVRSVRSCRRSTLVGQTPGSPCSRREPSRRDQHRRDVGRVQTTYRGE